MDLRKLKWNQTDVEPRVRPMALRATAMSRLIDTPAVFVRCAHKITQRASHVGSTLLQLPRLTCTHKYTYGTMTRNITAFSRWALQTRIQLSQTYTMSPHVVQYIMSLSRAYAENMPSPLLSRLPLPYNTRIYHVSGTRRVQFRMG